MTTAATERKPGLIDLLVNCCRFSTELMDDPCVKSGFQLQNSKVVADRLEELALIRKYRPDELRRYSQAEISLSCDAKLALGLYWKWITDQGGIPVFPPDRLSPIPR